ncbi:hypothetical protein BBP40_006824 [Aspergillus hancockii]|nr:hypothetical protein BBP40_006824 [Aspergillus hancockii]
MRDTPFSTHLDYPEDLWRSKHQHQRSKIVAGFTNDGDLEDDHQEELILERFDQDSSMNWVLTQSFTQAADPALKWMTVRDFMEGQADDHLKTPSKYPKSFRAVLPTTETWIKTDQFKENPSAVGYVEVSCGQNSNKEEAQSPFQDRSATYADASATTLNATIIPTVNKPITEPITEPLRVKDDQVCSDPAKWLLDAIKKDRAQVDSLQNYDGKGIDEADQFTEENWVARSWSITPNALRYVRNHGAVPRLLWDTHKVSVKLGKTQEFTMNTIKALPPINLPVVFACDGNRRKELNMVLRTNGFDWGPAAGKYGTSIPLDHIMGPTDDVLLAYEMNDALLPPDHEFPLRLIIPGHVGGRLVKWLSKFPQNGLRHDKKIWSWIHWYTETDTVQLLAAKSNAVRAFYVNKNTQPEHPNWNLTGMMNNCWYTIKAQIQTDPSSCESVLSFIHPTGQGIGSSGWMPNSCENRIEEIKNQPPVSANKYSIKDLQKGNNKKCALIVLNERVYNVTKFLDIHPGGKRALLSQAGKLVPATTNEFESIHSDDAKKWCQDFLRGGIDDDAKKYLEDQRKKGKDPEDESLAIRKHSWTEVEFIDRKELSKDTRQYTFIVPDTTKSSGCRQANTSKSAITSSTLSYSVHTLQRVLFT